VCADRICASELNARALTGAEIRTDRLNVTEEAECARLVIGEPQPLPAGAEVDADASLVVYGDVSVRPDAPSTTAMLILNGDLVLRSQDEARPPRIVAGHPRCPGPLVLDIVKDDACGESANYPPLTYIERGPGISAEIKQAQALDLPMVPYHVRGHLESRVFPAHKTGSEVCLNWTVLQTLWIEPIESVSTSGIFTRASTQEGSWAPWSTLSAEVVGL
jgi:hypothetical protein